jgi:hypothetical protein
MPIKDDEARRSYFREYMRKRRAGEKPAPPKDEIAEMKTEIAILNQINRNQSDKIEYLTHELARLTGIDPEQIGLTPTIVARVAAKRA